MSFHSAGRVSFDSSRLFRGKPASYTRRQIFIGLTGFRLALQVLEAVGVGGMGCEAPYIPSVSHIILDGLCTPPDFYASAHIHSPSRWACVMVCMVSRFPAFSVEEACL